MRETTEISGYHAHIYYDPASRAAAATLREAVAARFPAARLGSWHDEPVGPHPGAMYQIAFAIGDFPGLVPFLMLNRGELAILVHPVTEDEYADHARHALWLGAILPLRLEVLRKAAT